MISLQGSFFPSGVKTLQDPNSKATPRTIEVVRWLIGIGTQRKERTGYRGG